MYNTYFRKNAFSSTTFMLDNQGLSYTLYTYTIHILYDVRQNIEDRKKRRGYSEDEDEDRGEPSPILENIPVKDL